MHVDRKKPLALVVTEIKGFAKALPIAPSLFPNKPDSDGLLGAFFGGRGGGGGGQMERKFLPHPSNELPT